MINSSDVEVSAISEIKGGKKEPDRADTSWEVVLGRGRVDEFLFYLPWATMLCTRCFRRTKAHSITSEDKGHLQVSALKASVYLLEIVVSFFESHIPVTGSQRSPSSVAHWDRVLQATHHV